MHNKQLRAFLCPIKTPSSQSTIDNRGRSGELILPPLAPAELGVDQVLEGHLVDQVVERPSGGDVPDHEDSLTVPPGRQVTEEATDPADGLGPALPARVWGGQMLGSHGVHSRGRCPVELAVVTFAQPPVREHRQVGVREGQRSGLGRSVKVGGEDRGEAIATAPLSKFPGQASAPLGQLARQPASRYPEIVVLAPGMGFETSSIDTRRSSRKPVERSSLKDR